MKLSPEQASAERRQEILNAVIPSDDGTRDFTYATYWVYFIQMIYPPYYIKIGKAKSVLKRIKTLQTACPCQLEILLYFPDAMHAAERILHYNFRALRVRGNGEWFMPGPGLIDFIKDGREKFFPKDRYNWPKIRIPSDQVEVFSLAEKIC